MKKNIYLYFILLFGLALTTNAQNYLDTTYSENPHVYFSHLTIVDSFYYINHLNKCDAPNRFIYPEIWKIKPDGEIIDRLILSDSCEHRSLRTSPQDLFSVHDNHIYAVYSILPFYDSILAVYKMDLDLNVVSKRQIHVGRAQGEAEIIVADANSIYIYYDSHFELGTAGYLLKLDSNFNVIHHIHVPFFGEEKDRIQSSGNLELSLMPNGNLWLMSNTTHYINKRGYEHAVHIYNPNLVLVDYIHPLDFKGKKDHIDPKPSETGFLINDTTFLVSQMHDTLLGRYIYPVIYCHDMTGNLNWSTGIPILGAELILEIRRSPLNGDFYILGVVRDRECGSPSDVNEGTLLTRMSPDGNIRWTKTYYYQRKGQCVYSSLSGISFDRYGNIALAGILAPSSTPFEGWLLVLDENGCPKPNCQGDDFVVANYESVERDEFQINPNPTMGRFVIEASKRTSNLHWELLSLTGQVLQQGHISDHTSITPSTQGMYVVRVVDADGKLVYVEKVVRY